MNPAPSASVPRCKIWRWVFLVLGLCLAPFLVLAVTAVSFLTLDRDAAILRQRVMAATGSNWHTKVQLSVGRITIGAVRSGLAFVHNKDIEDARLALAAVRHASVGVYEVQPGPADWSRQRLFAESDEAMLRRGWTRLVGVADGKDTVLIYTPQNFDPDDPVDICVAVVNDRELVVVSASVDSAALADLVARHSGDSFKSRLRLAKFGI